MSFVRVSGESGVTVRAIGYLSRCGSDLGEAAQTLAEQNAAFLEFCNEHGYEPAATFLDGSCEAQRQGFAQLLDHLSDRRAGFTVVVVAAFQQLGADANQAARGLIQLRARGAQVVSLAEGPLDESAMLELWEREQPRERRRRVRDAMRRRAVRGQAMGRPPYGYRVGEEGRFEPVAAEAEVIRYIVRMYLDEGLGIRRIAQRLNGEGYRTRRDGNWSMVTVRDLLRNRAYVGTYTRFGVSVPNNHPALISSADFNAVQEKMAARRTAPGVSQSDGQFLLSGLVWCGESGARMIGVTRRQRWNRADGEPARGVYRYYQSGARTNQSVGGYHTRRAEELEEEVLAHLRGERSSDPQPALALAGDANAVVAEATAGLSKTLARLRTLDRRLGRALDAVSVGGGSMQALREDAAEIVAEYERAEADAERLRARLAAHSSDAQRRRRREQLLAQVREGWEGLSFEAQRSLLADLVERVVVRDEGIQTVLRA